MKVNDGLWLRLVSKRDSAADDASGLATMRPLPTAYVVEDDAPLRELYERMLTPLGIPVQTFESAEEFLVNYDTEEPGCLILDMRLPGMDGLALFSALRGMGANLPVIFVTGYADVASVRYALLAGASDYLEKPIDRRILLNAVREAIRVDHAQRLSAKVCERLSGLTTREWDVLRLVVAGKPNKIIGSDLNISQKTVEAHRARVMSKSGADSVADLVRIFGAFEAQRQPPLPAPPAEPAAPLAPPPTTRAARA
jgi:FixJ family two-component response regulator